MLSLSNNMWIDISVPLRGGMAHWPGDPEVIVDRISRIERGDGCNLSALSMCAHAGTHMDAPLHYFQGAASLDNMPLDATIGPARVIHIQDPESIRQDELASHDLREGERILFRTRNSVDYLNRDSFHEEFVHLTPQGARFLVSRGVRTVGIDYLSVGRPGPDGDETHRILLAAGVWIVESLDLSQTLAGDYEMVCLPIKILNSDGAPARAALRRKQ